MKGTILDYSVQTNGGIISGDDGQRYVFIGTEWKEPVKHPKRGDKVDFVTNEKEAGSIYLVGETNEKEGKPDKLIAAILAIFLGTLGIHKFYMGKKESGVLYLLITVISCGFLFFIPAIAGLIEGILYLVATQSDFESKYVHSASKWL